MSTSLVFNPFTSNFDYIDIVNLQQTVYVAKNGNDSTGLIGRPDSPFLTISAALTAITDAASNKPYAIMVSPGSYTEATLLMKPYVWVIGSADQFGGNTFVSVTAGNVGLDPSVATSGTRLGLINISLSGTTGINFDLQTLGGTVSRVFELSNVQVKGNVVFKANGSQDFFNVDSAFIFGTSQFSGGTVSLTTCNLVGNVTTDTVGTQPVTATILACLFYANIAANATGGRVNTTELNACGTTTMSVSGATSTVYADSISLPPNSSITLASGGSISRFTDAYSTNYVPSVSANWNTVPSLIQNGLDTLATSGIVKSQSANIVLASPSGSSGLPSFRALTTSDLPSGTVFSLGAVGAAPNANAGLITGNTLTLEPADGSNPGVLTATSQTIGGVKTFSSAPNFSSLTASTALVLDGSKNVASLAYSATGGTSNLVSRDTNGNSRSNNTGSSATAVTSAGGTTALTAASTRYQVLQGSSNQTFTLPDATTLFIGARYEFNNNSSGTLTVNNNGGSLVGTVPSGGSMIVICIATATANGAWDTHFEMPANASYGTAGMTVTGTITATSTIGASNLSGTNTGDISLTAVGASPSANAASLSGQALTLQPFDGTHPGVVTASGGGSTNFLRADGTWAAPSGSFTNPMTTTGDIIYASNTASPSTPARLGVGSNGNYLTVTAGLPAWTAVSPTTPTAIAAFYYVPSNQTPGAGNPINFSTKVIDTGNFVTTGASWKFQPNIAGYYAVSSILETTVASAGAPSLYKTGVFYAGLSQTAGNGTPSSTVIVNLNGTTDYLDIRASSSETYQSGGLSTLNTCYVNIWFIGQ